MLRLIFALPLLGACAASPPVTAPSDPAAAPAPPTVEPSPSDTAPEAALTQDAPSDEPMPQDGQLGGGFVLEQDVLYLERLHCGPNDGATGSHRERVADVEGSLTVRKLEGSRYEAKVADQTFTSQLTRCGYQLLPH